MEDQARDVKNASDLFLSCRLLQSAIENDPGALSLVRLFRQRKAQVAAYAEGFCSGAESEAQAPLVCAR